MPNILLSLQYPDTITIAAPYAVIVAQTSCPQVGYPAADLDAGGWTPSSGSNLYDMIDDAGMLDSGTYISSGQYPHDDTAKLDLSDLLQPGDGAVRIYVWARKRMT
jgi:hypothetical protein